MPYTGIIVDGSVTNTKIATGTISGDRLGANFNYPGDMTVQRLWAMKCWAPAVSGYSCCCFGGYFYGNCGICATGAILGGFVCGTTYGLCAIGYSSYGGLFCSCCGIALCAMTCGTGIGCFTRSSCCTGSYTCCEMQTVSMGNCGSALASSYFCCETCTYTSRSSSVCLAVGDCGLYTPSKAYIGGGLILCGNAGSVEGSISICGGCLCYYSSGVWHPVCKVV